MSVNSLGALTSLVANAECRVAIVDPAGVRADAFSDLLRALASSGLPLVIWTELSGPAIRFILQASRAVPTEVLFRGVDETDVGGLRTILRLGAVSSARALLLHRIAERLNPLPHDIRGACAVLFGRNPIPESVEAFALSTRSHPRTVQRHFLEVGLGHPIHVLQAARISRAWEPLQFRTTALDEVAELACCTSGKSLTAHFSTLVGLTPRLASRQLTLEAFVERLAKTITDPVHP